MIDEFASLQRIIDEAISRIVVNDFIRTGSGLNIEILHLPY